ncbi:hypothetical protein KKC45_00625 [Patescibacteria group bacterium]|nr:hypothetical protein [Patescibacteria group bacterium]
MQKIKELRKLFLEKGEIVGDIEETADNYDNNGNLINESIPTFTTESCEIGSYEDVVYFTFVVYSDSYNKKFIELLKNLSNFQAYCFKNFSEDLDVDSKEFEEKIKKEKYFQINFEYSVNDDSKYLFDRYSKNRNLILESGVKIVNQLEVDLTKD